MRSYRIGNKVRQEFIINLGTLENLPVEKHKILADKIESLLENNNNIFLDCDSETETLAKKFYDQIVDSKRKVNNTNISKQEIDSQDKYTDYKLVDVNSLTTQDVREVGGEWICKQAIEQIGLDKLLLNQKDVTEKISKTALISVISRMLHPASDLETERWLNDNSGINHLMGLKPDAITRHDLTKASNFLLKNKEVIENELYKNITDLFSLQSKIVIYDLTNIFFEGRKLNSDFCKFGRSKEKRNDCRLICLALLIDENGFIFFSKFYAGNQSEPMTLADVVTDLRQRTNINNNVQFPVIVMDAGITTEKNLSELRDNKQDYICVSRCKLKDYEITETETITVSDNRKNKIELKKVKIADKKDYFLYVKSELKQKKEQSMNQKFTEKFEQELQLFKEGLLKKGARRKIADVYQRIGRLKERNNSICKLYEINFTQDTEKGIITSMDWTKKDSIKNYEGTYFIRYSNQNLTEQQIWQTYNTIREVESTFRTLKTDLKIRPVFHQNDNEILSHIFTGIIAYQVVNTIRFQLKRKKNNLSWEKLVQILNTYKYVTTEMITKEGDKIILKYCTRPNEKVVNIFDEIDYKILPFRKQKYVVTNLQNQ
jgi:transposase